ncbi:hypothetical protein HK102_002167, partial [Quaeritorhiza haematococci]
MFPVRALQAILLFIAIAAAPVHAIRVMNNTVLGYFIDITPAKDQVYITLSTTNTSLGWM